MAVSAPVRHQHPHSCAVAEVRAWIDGLPRLNPAEHSEHMLSYLQYVNAQTLSCSQRYELMELLFLEVSHLLEGSRQQTLQIRFPLTAEQRDGYHSIQQLLEQAFLGYRRIAFEASQTDDSPDSVHHLLCSSLLRAIELLSQRILKALALYRSPPKGAWIELHNLYRYAEQKDMLSQRVEHVADWRIGDAYFQMVLTGLVQPFNLMRNEIYKVHQRLLKWSKALKVIHPDEIEITQFNSRAEQAFIIDFEMDTAAVYASSNLELEIAEQRYRLLDMNEIQRIIEAEIKKLTVKEAPSFGEWQERDLLRRMRNHLNQRNVRENARTPDHHAVNIVVGLSGSHYYMSELADFLPEDDELNLHGDSIQLNQSLSLMPLEDENWRESETRQKLASGVIKPRAFGFDYEDQDNDVWTKGERATVRSKSRLEESMDRRVAASANRLESKDHSAGGMGFVCAADSAIKLHVGELMALRHDDGRYQLGTVRWMRTLEDESLEVGCQLLANTANPIAIRGIEGQGSRVNYQRALLLDDGSVIAPAGLYMPSSAFICNTGKALVPYKITRLISSTNSYSHFVVEQLAESAENKQKIITSFYALLGKQEQ